MSVAAALLLAYTGDEPVNVGWFFACTVGIQWLILLASLLIWFLRRTTHLFEDFRPLRNLLAGLLWSLSAALQQLPGEQRQRMRAQLMGIRRKGEVFQLLVWPLLMITQIFGVFFNVGVLIALLLPLGRDVAFGWQSTVKTSPGHGLPTGFLDRDSLVVPSTASSHPRRCSPEPFFLQRRHSFAFFAGHDVLVAFSVLRHHFLRSSRENMFIGVVRCEFASGAARFFL